MPESTSFTNWPQVLWLVVILGAMEREKNHEATPQDEVILAAWRKLQDAE